MCMLLTVLCRSQVGKTLKPVVIADCGEVVAA